MVDPINSNTPTVARYGVKTPSISDDEKKANAYLMAVAPEMYKELQEISFWLDTQSGMGDWRKHIEKLLSKARGESCT